MPEPVAGPTWRGERSRRPSPSPVSTACASAGDGFADPEELARCSDLRAVYLALCLIAFRDVFGDDPDRDGYIRYFVGQIR